jgi:uncharacterized protein
MVNAVNQLIPMPVNPKDVLRINPFFPFEEEGRKLLFVVNNAAFAEMDESSWWLANQLAGQEKVLRHELIAQLSEAFGDKEAEDTFLAFEQLEVLSPFSQPSNIPDRVPAAIEPLQSLVLHVAHDCNLRCGYCYADYGRYGDDPGMMTEEMAIEHLAQFFDQLQDRRKIHVTMFGGEPLMNLPVVFAAHKYAKERAEREGRKISFSLTTNGTLLTDDLVKFFKEEDYTITVSIDGPPDINNRLRPLQSGGGSYDAIMDKVRGTGIDAIARVTLTCRSLQMHRIVHHLAEAGFREVGVSPVATGSARFDISSEQLPVLLDEMRMLSNDFVEWAKKGKIFPFSNIRMLVDQIAAGQPRKMPCGAGTALAAVDNKGDWYACHRLVGEEQFAIGNLENGIDSEKRFDLLNDMHPRSRTSCETCWARYLCGGGCHHIAWLHSDKGEAPWMISDVFCDFLRSWYRIGLHTYARMVEEAPEMLGMVPRSKPACSQPMGL